MVSSCRVLAFAVTCIQWCNPSLWGLELFLLHNSLLWISLTAQELPHSVEHFKQVRRREEVRLRSVSSNKTASTPIDKTGSYSVFSTSTFNIQDRLSCGPCWCPRPKGLLNSLPSRRPYWSSALLRTFSLQWLRVHYSIRLKAVSCLVDAFSPSFGGLPANETPSSRSSFCAFPFTPLSHSLPGDTVKW